MRIWKYFNIVICQGQEGVYKRRSSFDEPLVVDNIYEQCEADYAQHDNDAYNSDHSQASTSSNGEDSAIEEQSSKLWGINNSIQRSKIDVTVDGQRPTWLECCTADA